MNGLVTCEGFGHGGMVLAICVGFSRVRTVLSPMNGLVTGERIGHCGHG